MVNWAVPGQKRVRTPATFAGFTSTSMICDSAVDKMRS